MSQPFSVKPGQAIHLPITWDDGATPPGEAQKPSDISYKASPDGLVTLTPEDAGVVVTGIKAGTVTVEVDATGDGPLTDTATGTVELPLARRIHLNP